MAPEKIANTENRPITEMVNGSGDTGPEARPKLDRDILWVMESSIVYLEGIQTNVQCFSPGRKRIHTPVSSVLTVGGPLTNPCNTA